MKDKSKITQTIRIVDVVILAPFMIYAGARPSNLPTWIKWGLIGTGISTFVYNGYNYFKNIKPK